MPPCTGSCKGIWAGDRVCKGGAECPRLAQDDELQAWWETVLTRAGAQTAKDKVALGNPTIRGSTLHFRWIATVEKSHPSPSDCDSCTILRPVRSSTLRRRRQDIDFETSQSVLVMPSSHTLLPGHGPYHLSKSKMTYLSALRITEGGMMKPIS